MLGYGCRSYHGGFRVRTVSRWNHSVLVAAFHDPKIRNPIAFLLQASIMGFPTDFPFSLRPVL